MWVQKSDWEGLCKHVEVLNHEMGGVEKAQQAIESRLNVMEKLMWVLLGTSVLAVVAASVSSLLEHWL